MTDSLSIAAHAFVSHVLHIEILIEKELFIENSYDLFNTSILNYKYFEIGHFSYQSVY